MGISQVAGGTQTAEVRALLLVVRRALLMIVREIERQTAVDSSPSVPVHPPNPSSSVNPSDEDADYKEFFRLDE